MTGQEDCNTTMDLLIVLDVTASMGSYIESAKNNIIEICSILQKSGRLASEEGLRVGLVAYRDYPSRRAVMKLPVEGVILPHPFTADLKVMRSYLSPLRAEGGDDYPEAFSSALEYAYEQIDDWRDDALKVIIVITDAAPHGINEKGDDWPDGSPPGISVRDPLELSREMADSGYSIFVLACEPTLGKTTEYAIEFYKAISARTPGTYCSLTNSKHLAAVIIGIMLEKVDLSALSLAYREEIWRLIFEEGRSFDSVVDQIHQRMSSQNQRVTTLQTGNIYNDLPAAMNNYKVFVESENLAEARRSLTKVRNPRHKSSAMKSVNRANESERKSSMNHFTVTVFFKNTGTNNIELRSFDAESGELKEQMIVPNGHIRIAKLSVNIPVNFALVCGRITKNFSRTFHQDSDIDVEQMFNNS